MTDAVDKNLIFDLGAHIGLDTGYYLRKGFRVVALEANPELCKKMGEEFQEYVSAGVLHIINRCFWNIEGKKIKFYVNTEKDDWSSAFHNWATKGNHNVKEIESDSITISSLFDNYGIPRYIKCDIEGADEMFCHEMMVDGRRPDFVSIEGGSVDAIIFLRASGYNRVQIVNQALHHLILQPNPSKEGKFVSQKFNGFMSGPFGLDLPKDRWTTIGKALENYFAFRSLRAANDRLARGWLDFHFTSAAMLI